MVSTTTRYPSRYSPQLPSHPICRPSTPTQSDTRSCAHSLDSAPILPKAVVIGCEGGSYIRALDNIFKFTVVTDHDRRALECARANGMVTRAMFKRTCPGDPKYGSWVKSLKLEAIIGNISRRTSELEEGPQGTAGAANTIGRAFISS